MSRPGSAQKPKPAPASTKKKVSAPIWRQLIALGIVVLAAQLALTSVPALAKIGDIGPKVASVQDWIYTAAGTFIAAGLLVLVLSKAFGKRPGAEHHGLGATQAAHIAVATELRLPVETIRLTVKQGALPVFGEDQRLEKIGWYASGAALAVSVLMAIGTALGIVGLIVGLPCVVVGVIAAWAAAKLLAANRVAKKVTIQLPQGQITEDPGKRLAERLTPILGQLRKESWDARKGRCVLMAGSPSKDDGVEVPVAATDPKERALQVLEPFIGKQLAAEVTKTDKEGVATEIVVRHPVNPKVRESNTPLLQAVVDERMPERDDQSWGLEIMPRGDSMKIFLRPALPKLVDSKLITDYGPGTFDPAIYGEDPRVLPCATAAGDLICGWNISRKTDKPHALLIGATGGGKTNAISTMATHAARQGAKNRDIEIWGLDPKMIELMGLADFPGVTRLAFRVEAMAHLIDAAYDEMMSRYELIKAYKVHPDDLPALVLILDEYLILVSMLTFWWKSEGGGFDEKTGLPKGGRGPCPQLDKVKQILALSRSAQIFVLLGVQRPDATLFMAGSRDNLRFRGSLGQLSPEGAQMVWNSETIGVKPTTARGRGMITAPDGTPVEAQYWRTPRLDPHPMYRDRLSPEDRKLVEALTPERYSPQPLTKGGLWLPPSAELPKPGGVEEEMEGVQDIVPARDLQEGDLIKLEDSTGRMTNAIVEYAEYDEDRRMVTLDFQWEGGSSEQQDMPGDDEIWYLGKAE